MSRICSGWFLEQTSTTNLVVFCIFRSFKKKLVCRGNGHPLIQLKDVLVGKLLARSCSPKVVSIDMCVFAGSHHAVRNPFF